MLLGSTTEVFQHRGSNETKRCLQIKGYARKYKYDSDILWIGFALPRVDELIKVT